MSPVKRHSSKQDQQRQDRGKSNCLARKEQLKIERLSSGDQQSNILQQRHHSVSYNLRSSQRPGRCHGENGIQPEEHIVIDEQCNCCSDRDSVVTTTNSHDVGAPCRGKCLSTVDTNHFHSTQSQRELPDSTHTTNDGCRNCFPEDFPDLNFHHSFGSFLTRKNPVVDSVDHDIGRYWTFLNKSPTMLQYHIHTIGDRYREAFRRFFTADPISLHGHVSDASSPALLTSLISHLTSEFPTSGDNPFLGEEHKANPCIAMLEGSYGAGYGPLAHNSVLEFVRPLANGRNPIMIQTHNAADIDDQVKKAKQIGCIALIAEIVCARDGTVISQTAWKHLLRACKRYNLILVVDEALTSIRCGAPFAYQLPQFQKYGYPDLVLFGKAVKTNGIAVDWRGVNMRKLGITDPEERLFMTLQWQERLTEMAPAASLLTSWGTIVLAEQEQWPLRARKIGRVLRATVESEGVEQNLVGGLHSLLYLRIQDQARIKSPVIGANAGKYVRWFPTMDQVMLSEEELRTKVFGSGSIAHRGNVAAYLESMGVELGFCSRCGQAVEAGRRLVCRLCVVGVCEECEAGEHVCPMKG